MSFIKTHSKKLFSVLLIICMIVGTIFPDGVFASADETSSDALSMQADDSKTSQLNGNLYVTDDTGNTVEDSDRKIKIESDNSIFSITDSVSMLYPDDNAEKEISSALADTYPNEYRALSEYDISLKDQDGKAYEPDSDVEVSLYLPDDEITSFDDADLYHIKDGKAKKVDYSIETEPDSEEKYVSFTTDSFSPFVFAKEDTNKRKDPKELRAKDFVSFSKKNMAVQDDESDPIKIVSLGAQLFYGAEKQDDGTYVWKASNSASGHHFNYRIAFSTSGKGEAKPKTVRIVIPKSTLIDRDGNPADTVEWSIPSEEDVENSRDAEGNISDDAISQDINYAYKEDGDNYVIYNFRTVSAGDNGYIELSYVTSKSTLSYVDMQKMKPFTCTMEIGNDASEDAGTKKTAAPIYTAIDTTARITSTQKQAPSERIQRWNAAWGSEVRPADPSKYYYLVWPIRSNVEATQPYNFKIDDTAITGNLDIPESKMRVLGVRYSGESEFTKAHEAVNQTQTSARYDYVLTAIPLDVYANADTWRATNKETATLTPYDKVDAPTEKSSSQSWQWTRPVFSVPSGRLNVYKCGDNTGYLSHLASSLDFQASNYTRYDLEDFNGHNGTEKKLKEYDKFDYASYLVGYPYPWTRDTSASDYDADKPWTAYGKKPVKYVLTDEGVYLNNALSETSKEENKLSADDFYINKLEYSYFLRDAGYDEAETGNWLTKGADTSKDVLVFEGKFGNSDTWTKFATYDIGNKKSSYEENYVERMNGSSIVFKKDADLTAYRVTTVNAHYVTEVYTVPFITLKDSDHVMGILDGGKYLALTNHNKAQFYELNDGVDYTSADYQELGQKEDNWEEISDPIERSASDYAIVTQRDSSLVKYITSTSNDNRKRYFTISWSVLEQEHMTTGNDGTLKYIPQHGGTFYDLLPEGSTLMQDSIVVSGGGNTLDESAYTVRTISNYRNTGRTMLIVKVNSSADYYRLTYDTRYTWNNIKDYGTAVYNSVSYETGNDSITNGAPDDGGHGKDRKVFDDLSKNTGETEESVTAKRFLYAEESFDISVLTSASAGLTKKVKNESGKAYSYEGKTEIGGFYSYELRFLNSNSTDTENMILFDSLENYNPGTRTNDGRGSDWKGTLSSIDVSQLEERGADPVIYISEVPSLNIADHHNLTDTSVWTKVTGSTNLSKAKAVAIDVSKKKDGSAFRLASGQSIVAYLYMKAPSSAPDVESGYPKAYNNVYISDDVMGTNGSALPFFIHQDYTKLSLAAVGKVSVHKINAKTDKDISGITWRLYGTSDAGEAVDISQKTNSSGNVSFTVEKGTYILQETDATDDYLLDSTEHKVVIDGSGHTTIDGTDYTDKAISISNKPRVHTDIQFSKRDQVYNTTKLAGAVYRLSGTSAYNDDVLMTAESLDKQNGDDASKGLVTFKNVPKGAYTLKEITAPDGYVLDKMEYTVIVDDDGNYTIGTKAKEDIYDTETVTKYSHTSNVSDDGTQNGNYGNNWTNANITGTDRGDTSKAHVVTIPGSDKLHVKITWGGESSSYDWATVWEGSHPDYTANSNSSSAISGAQKLGGGSHTSASNTKEFDIDGDSVTFGYRSDGGGSGDGYGYYAVVTGEGKSDRILYHKGDLIPVMRGNDIYTTQTVTKYSHTSNVSDDGTQNGNYGNNWTNANITGTDRGDTSKAHVVTIPGASTLHVKITWGGESSSYDWATVWEGSHPDYTANSNSSSAISGAQKLGGGSHTSASNTKEFDIDGDSVTFGYRSDGSGSDDGYGYYAVVTGKVTAQPDKGDNTCILTDEPLHYITFTKKSNYDKSVVGDAEFSLTGISDSGNAVDKKAVSDKDTGTVRFDKLESGTYVLEETKAPSGYDKDENKYAVKVENNGHYTINGLTKTDNIYDFYDTKKQDKQITITKVWNDGEGSGTKNGSHTDGDGNQDPSKLAITIQTNVPKQSVRTYSIKFDANGGSYGSGQDSVNTLTYNAKNEVTSGTYHEPAAADEDHGFVGWSTNKNATSEDSSITLTPNELTNSYLNGREGESTTTLYAVYKERDYVYYAVSPYGIGKETLEGGAESGITFGPATGNMFFDYTNSSSVSGKYEPMLNAHKISDSTYLINDNSVTTSTTTDGTATDSTGEYVSEGTNAPSGRTTVTKAMMQADMDAVQPEGQPALTDSNSHVIEGTDAGMDAEGNAYRCIHYDNWNTIMYWNDHDPHVYDKCVVNHCSKRLILRPTDNMAGITWLTRKSDSKQYANNQIYLYDNEKIRGDGASEIGTSTWERSYSDNGHSSYPNDNSTDADDMYSASLIRARLVGADRLINPNQDYVDGTKPASEGTSALGAWPEAIRNHIGAKALYDTVYSNKRTDNTSGPYYDKLWLFDYNEMFQSSNSAGSSTYTERAATGFNYVSYGSRGSRGWWWLRSRGTGGYGYGVYYSGGYGDGYVSNYGAVAPGFTLSKSA